MSGLRLFYSYSHLDAAYQHELEKWLVILRNDGLVSEWYDGKMIGGDNVSQEIRNHLREADVILLLLSQDFLSSKACMEEMQYAFDTLTKKRVVPIILKPCTWKDTECVSVLALPKDGTPVDEWVTKEKAWEDVYNGIKRIVMRLRLEFDIRSSFQQQLQNVEFVSQRKRKVILDDTFVFPSFTGHKNDFNGDSIEESFFLDPKNKRIMISGAELSGKSTVMRKLYLLSHGIQPSILLDGDSIRATKNFEEVLRHEFATQIAGDFDLWLAQKNKVAIIDNYSHKTSANFIHYLKETFSRIVISVDEEEYLVYFKDDPSFADFEVVAIKPLSRSKQEQLIRKWMSIGAEDTRSNEIDDIEIDNLEDKINTIISSSMIVPRYPFYILSILQTLEAFMPKDFEVTAYGHCYHALVTARLLKKNIKSEDLDSCFNYLQFLAYDIYTKTKSGDDYTADDYDHLKSEYRSNFYVKDSVLARLENDDFPILSRTNRVFRFEYPYLYYFFLGKYLAEKGQKAEIDGLFEDLHSKVNSYAIIFMVHHTQNKDLLETLLLNCMYSFDSVSPARLTSEETKFMTALVTSLPRSIISNRSVEENRKAERSSWDQIEGPEDVDETPVEVEELYRGLKILDILGQIVKNRAGSFLKPDVIEMLSQVQDLGLRILTILLDNLRNPDFKDWLVARLDEEQRSLAENSKEEMAYDKKVEFVEKAIQLFGYIITVAMISKISFSINSSKLLEPIRELSEKRGLPSYSIIAFLVSMQQNSLDANWLEKIHAHFKRENNQWALRTLSYFVQNHLNTHNVKFDVRQKAFDILELKYRPNK